jgi:hypothetical protein
MLSNAFADCRELEWDHLSLKEISKIIRKKNDDAEFK